MAVHEPNRWDQIEEIFLGAAELPTAERARYLSEKCPDDEVRREVDSLLQHSGDGTGSMLNTAVGGIVSAFAKSESPEHYWVGKWLGPYRIVRLIGQGGMGCVFDAERDDREFRQRVAIKLVLGAAATPNNLLRFRQERQILAQLHHTNIARLLDGGTTPDGQPYLVMEFIEGEPITKWADRKGLSVRERVGLFRQVCDAVSYAHQNLVVHRDIKPANILVTAEGVPKLLDFGIAKLLQLESEDGDTMPMPTITGGAVLLTPDYASPEQVRGDTITTATDVYALGAVLYDLVTGTKPHSFTEYTPFAIAQAICETEIRPPSKSAAERRPDLAKEIDSDVDNIILTAMRKESIRRYGSVVEFSEDLRRCLSNLPVKARPDSSSYRIGKFIQRNRYIAAAIAIAAFGLLAGSIIAINQARRADYQARRAEARFNQVRKLANIFLFDLWAELRRLPGATPAQAKLVKTGLEYVDSLAQESAGDPSLQAELATAYEKLGDIQGYPGEPNLGDFAACLRSYKKGLSLRQDVYRMDPSPKRARELAETHNDFSYLSSEAGDWTVAIDHANRCLNLVREVQAKSPEPNDNVMLGRCSTRLGDAESSRGNRAEAIGYYAGALDLRKKELLRKPDTRIRLLVAIDHYRVGAEQRRAGALLEAIENFRSAEVLLLENLRVDPISFNSRIYLGHVHETWAEAYLDPRTKERQAKAMAAAHSRTGLGYVQPLIDRDPGDQDLQDNGRHLRYALARALSASDPLAALQEAEKASKAAMDQFQRNPMAYSRNSRVFPQITLQAELLLRLGRKEEARTVVEGAAGIMNRLFKPDATRTFDHSRLAHAHATLAALQAQLGETEEGRKNMTAALRMATELPRPARDFGMASTVEEIEQIREKYFGGIQ